MESVKHAKKINKLPYKCTTIFCNSVNKHTNLFRKKLTTADWEMIMGSFGHNKKIITIFVLKLSVAYIKCEVSLRIINYSPE